MASISNLTAETDSQSHFHHPGMRATETSRKSDVCVTQAKIKLGSKIKFKFPQMSIQPRLGVRPQPHQPSEKSEPSTAPSFSLRFFGLGYIKNGVSTSRQTF